MKFMIAKKGLTILRSRSERLGSSGGSMANVERRRLKIIKYKREQKEPPNQKYSWTCIKWSPTWNGGVTA